MILIAFLNTSLLKASVMKLSYTLWKKFSIAQKIYFIVGIMAVLILSELAALQFAIQTLTATRSFVGGESIWSKSQKNAVISLLHYGVTKDEKDFIDFQKYLQVPDGDRLARLEFEKKSPNESVIQHGFLLGNIQHDDIKPMIKLMYRFQETSFLVKAISIWKEADNLLEELKLTATRYHQAQQSNDLKTAHESLLKIKKINDKLTATENEFSYQLAEASRWIEFNVLAFLSIAVLIIESLGLTLTFITIKNISKGLKSLNEAAQLIGQNRFKKPIQLVTAHDEIGELAKSINTMGKLLHQSYNELEDRVKERTTEVDQSRNQLDIILKGISDGIVVLGTHGYYIYANLAGAKICGFDSVEELLKTPQNEVIKFFDFTDQNGKIFPIQNLPSKLALQGVKNNPDVLLLLKQKRTGDEKWVLLSSTPIFDENKKTKFVVTIFKDFTDRKYTEDSVKFLDQANRILSASLDCENNLQKLTDFIVPALASWCSIHFIENEGTQYRQVAISSHNPANKIILQNFFTQIIPDWYFNKILNKIYQTAQSELFSDLTDDFLKVTFVDQSVINQFKNNHIQSMLIVPLTSRAKVVGILTLVSTSVEKKYRIQELNFIQELAKRAGVSIDNAVLYKNAQIAVKARDEFLSIASHELKTPLTSLSLQIEMTKSQIKPAEGQSPSLEKLEHVFTVAEKQVHRLNRLVEDLLDVSRIQSGNINFDFSESNLSELVKEMIIRFSDQLAKAKCSIEFKVENNIKIYMDASKIEQVIDNLITNAIKYAPGKPIHIFLTKKNDFVEFIIADEGPGIPIEKQNVIFDRFERANSSKAINGLGLGLFIVKEILKAHQGSVRLESEPGKGAKFIVEFPYKVKKDITVNSEKDHLHGV